MMRVLGRDNSVNVQKVMWLVREFDLPVTREDYGGPFGATDQPDYLALNPNGTVPTLVDGDVVLWESNAILRYLCDSYGDGHWRPQTAADWGRAGQWMDWGLSCLTPPMITLFRQLVRTAPDARNPALITDARDQAARYWTLLDRHLSDRDYVLGAHPGLPDIALGGLAYRWHAMRFDRPPLPALERWYQSLTARPAFRQNVMRPLT